MLIFRMLLIINASISYLILQFLRWFFIDFSKSITLIGKKKMFKTMFKIYIKQLKNSSLHFKSFNDDNFCHLYWFIIYYFCLNVQVLNYTIVCFPLSLFWMQKINDNFTRQWKLVCRNTRTIWHSSYYHSSNKMKIFLEVFSILQFKVLTKNT